MGEYFLKIRDSEKVEDIPKNAEKEYLTSHSEVDSQMINLSFLGKTKNTDYDNRIIVKMNGEEIYDYEFERNI